MKLPPLRICRTIRKLHERFLRAENEHVAANARQKIEAKLAKHGLKWEDLDAVLKKADKADRHKEGEPNVLTLIRSLTVKYIWMTEEERWAYPLWVLHTYVYKRYNKTPRLAILPIAPGKSWLVWPVPSYAGSGSATPLSRWHSPAASCKIQGLCGKPSRKRCE